MTSSGAAVACARGSGRGASVMSGACLYHVGCYGAGMTTLQTSPASGLLESCPWPLAGPRDHRAGPRPLRHRTCGTSDGVYAPDVAHVIQVLWQCWASGGGACGDVCGKETLNGIVSVTLSRNGLARVIYCEIVLVVSHNHASIHRVTFFPATVHHLQMTPPHVHLSQIRPETLPCL